MTLKGLVHAIPADASKFYSPYVFSAQRLPGRDTPVTEGSDGRIVRVTIDYKTVWEWISPYYTHDRTGPKSNTTYRGYRHPYSYVPQGPTSTEIAIPRIDNTTFRTPNAGALGAKMMIDVEGTLPHYQDMALCMVAGDEEDSSRREEVLSIGIEVFELVSGTTEWKGRVWEQQERPVLVLFGVERCAHCKALYPILEEVLQEEFANNFLIRYTGADASKDVVAACHAQGIPVVVMYRNGEEVWRFHGEHNYDDICNLLGAMFTRFCKRIKEDLHTQGVL